LEKFLKTNLSLRIVSAIAMMTIFLGSLLEFNNLFIFLILTISLLCFMELRRILNLSLLVSIFNLILCVLFIYLFLFYHSFLSVFISVFILFILSITIFFKKYPIIFDNFLPSLYLPAFSYSCIYLSQTNPKFLIMIFLGIWAVDIGGYIFGRLFGIHFIFPITSPKKTWEGLIGSFILAMLSLYLYNLYIFNFEFVDLFSLVILVVLSAVLGDYFESFIKRKYFIKDSGAIIPGHGGILDRMDSAIVTLPIIILLFGYI